MNPDPTFVVVAISTETKEICVYSGFSSEEDAQEFVEADLFGPQFDQLAVLPVIEVTRDPDAKPL